MRSQLRAKARNAALLAVVGGFALASAASPASATYYTYNIGGNFGNNTGPNQKGTFAGQARWDSSLNGGRGAWYEWTFDLFSSGGTKLQTLSHTDAGAGCFASPLAKGNFAVGQYASSAPGGAVCVGDNVDAEAAGANPDQTYLAIFNNVPYTWNGNTANYSYFRLKFAANGPGGTSVDSANLTAVDANAQSAAGLGWAAMTDAPNEPCTAYNTFPTLAGNCPYAGNTQNYQGISGITKVSVVTTYQGETPDTSPVDPPAPPPGESVPGPLPLLGASAAFGWSRRLRRRLGRRAGA